MRPSIRLVATLLFGSGLAALVYQTAWQRMFRLVFGASTGASAAVLGIFLGGLGVGGVWLGRRAERHERPLAFYGNLEIGVALAAALTPVLVEIAAAIYTGLGGSSALGGVGATAVRLLLATAVMGPSVVLMGGTLPAAARAVEVEDDAGRGRLATLYAVNTGGAVTGALLSTFVLFEVFGTRMALWIAVLVNLLVAIVARSRGRVAEPIPVVDAPKPSKADARAKPRLGSHMPSAEDAPPAPAPLVYAAAGVVGFAFLYLELVWYRMLGPILGGSTFTFGLILAVALAGIGIGGWLYSRRSHARPATLTLLALTVALEALAVGVPLALGDTIALYAAYTRGMGSMGFSVLVGVWTTICAIVILPAAIVSGYQFPVLFALLGRGRKGVARQVGTAYAFNTIGSIAGSVLAGFYLIPLLGAVGSWRAIVLLLAALAAVALLVGVRAEGRRAIVGGAFAAVATVLAVVSTRAEGPTAVWRHAAIGAGRATISTYDKNGIRRWKTIMNDRLLWERDGVESSVGLSVSSGYSFLVNGKSDGAVIVDRATQTMLALLPALLHPAPKKVFVLGLGTGMSAGWVSVVEGVERVDVAELEPAIIDVARHAAPANHAVLERPNVEVFNGDGREFLLTTEHAYDVIVSEPSNPYRAGIASLFTREFYEMSAQRLAPGGLFGQWVQAYEVDSHTIRIVLKTMRTVFPFVEAWQTQSGDFLFIASREEPLIDADVLRRRVAAEPFKSALPRTWLVQDAEGVLSHFVARHQVVDEVSAGVGVPTNTDDANVLEFTFARTLGIEGFDGVRNLHSVAQRRKLDRPNVTGRVDWARVDEQRGRAWLISGGEAPQDLPYADSDSQGRALAVEAGCRGQVDAVLPAWNGEPRDVIEVYALAQGHAHEGNQEALTLAARLEAEGFEAEAELVRSRYHADKGKMREAVDAALRGVGHLRKKPLPICATTKQTLRMLTSVVGRDPALARTAAVALMEGPLSIYAANELRRETIERLAFVTGDPELCVRALGPHLEKPRWSRWLLFERNSCLSRAGHPLASQAQADVVEFLEATSGDFAAGLKLPPKPKPLPPRPVPEVTVDAAAGPAGPKDGGADATRD